MGERTRRRKLQKRAKRNRYGKCAACGHRTYRRVDWVVVPNPDELRYDRVIWGLVKKCQNPSCRREEEII